MAESFEQDVYALVRQVPAGRVTTYGAVAKALGKPKGARQVGWVLNTSFTAQPPVPAHRVVNRQGLLTGAVHFPPETPMADLLEREGVNIHQGGVVEFAQRFWDPNKEIQ